MRVLALSGGVGGAKLALGLSLAIDPAELAIVANTGDDFEHLGLTICPDVDTLMYTLAGVANTETGWGRSSETWSFLGALADLGEEDWFRLGDRDLAVHVARTHKIRAGESLSSITDRFRRRLGVKSRIAPMSDDPVRTMVRTELGELSFQHYFVRERCAPVVRGFRYHGADRARPSAIFSEASSDPALMAIVLCPSNPFVSVDPILALPGVEGLLSRARAPVVAVSPIVGGAAIKGPAAKMMAELGMEPSAAAIARRYAARDLLDGFVLDVQDAALVPAIEALGVRVLLADTIMRTLDDRARLAREILAFAETIG
jgi:LPPG:FO 2-phospho-L-lactate transferase